MTLPPPAGIYVFPGATATRLERLMFAYRADDHKLREAIRWIIGDNLARRNARGRGNRAQRRLAVSRLRRELDGWEGVLNPHEVSALLRDAYRFAVANTRGGARG